MINEKITCSFIDKVNNRACDMEIPLDITCDDLVKAINESMKLNIEIPSKNAYFRSENPIALIQGDRTLGELGLRVGSVIIFGT